MDEFAVGDRVYWFDPDGDLRSDFGTVIEIKEDDVIVIRTDRGSEVNALESELIHDYVHT